MIISSFKYLYDHILSLIKTTITFTLSLALVGVLSIGAAQEAYAVDFNPNLFDDRPFGGPILEPCSTIKISDLKPEESPLSHLIQWSIDGQRQPDGLTVIIPAGLMPGVHEIIIVIPQRTFIDSDGMVQFDLDTTLPLEFRIASPINQALCTDPPVAPDFTVDTLIFSDASGVTTINFAEHVFDPTDDYEDLLITFRLQDESLYSSFFLIGGTTGNGMPTVGDTLTVAGLAPIILIPGNDRQSLRNTELLIDYTVTNLKGVFDSGVITVKFFEFFTNIEARPYTIDARLYGYPTVDLVIPNNDLTSFVVPEIDSNLYAAHAISLSTTGIGNATGTLSIVDGSAVRGSTLSYTPVPGFVGTETFDYTATFRGATTSDDTPFDVSTSSSVFHIVVPESSLRITPNLNVHQTTGGITLEPCSTISLSDLPAPSLAHLTRWSIDGNSFPDGTSIIIPNDLTPGIHTVEFVTPHTLNFAADDMTTFDTITRDDFKFRIASSADPSLQCSESPNASDFTIQTLITGDTSLFVTIYFAEHVSDPTDDYEDLSITFRLQDESLYESLSSFMGIAGDGTPTAGDTLVATTPPVIFMPNDASSFLNTALLVDYTVTNSGGFSDSGVVTIQFAEFFTDIKAAPYTINAGLYGLPTLELDISHSVIPAFVVPEIDDELYTAELIILTTTGIGNATGTLTITPASMGHILSYTPMPDYVGTETFDYTASFSGSTSSSVFHIVVPALLCSTNIDAGASFGGMDAGQASDTRKVIIMNTGNADAQVMMKGDDWKSVADDTNIMNVDVTKYSVIETDTYDQKTSFTTTLVDVGDKLGEGSLSVYLQLFAELIDDSFRGDAAQELTVSSDCS